MTEEIYRDTVHFSYSDIEMSRLVAAYNSTFRFLEMYIDDGSIKVKVRHQPEKVKVLVNVIDDSIL